MESKVKLSDFLYEELIFTNKTFLSSEAVFEEFYDNALSKGYVTETFLEKIKEREQTFPTGIALTDYNVAIPHTDPECIKKEFVAIYTLEKPVKFSRMDDPIQQVDVDLIFILGLNQPHTQLEMLQCLMGVIQDRELIQQLKNCEATQLMEQIKKLDN